MTHVEIRDTFLRFFEARGHAIIPSASLVPENDPSVLFTTAGMQPLVPYLLGQSHPKGRRLANIQKCVRTQDIDEVGDNTHDTFFEMMGNWSLGDYFKEEAIRWSYELLTSKTEGFGLDPSRMYVTIFEGDENAPRDEESERIWKSLGISNERIFFLSAKSNWWSPGDNGPCGPDTEIFYDVTKEGLGDLTKDEFLNANDKQNVVEIWNNVFMEYEKKDGTVIGKLSQKNVDTGAGLERFAMVLQGKSNIFDTDLFDPLITKIKERTGSEDIKRVRIVADHIRTAVFMVADDVVPSNTDRGYVLRRLIRRAKYYYNSIGGQDKVLSELVHIIADIYKDTDYKIRDKTDEIDSIIKEEEQKFFGTILHGKKLLEKILQSEKHISGENAFKLFSTYGFPIELTKEIVEENNSSVDEAGFAEEMKKHQELSRSGAKQKFRGGLAGHDEASVKYHTATHLLHQALREVLGKEVLQRGSNITPGRMRFDFSFNRKLTEEEKRNVEGIVNEKIKENLPVSFEEMNLDDARKSGAIGIFDDAYADKVYVYSIGDFSKEICGGPHVENTGVLGEFKIKKEEAASSGVRRIKSVLE